MSKRLSLEELMKGWKLWLGRPENEYEHEMARRLRRLDERHFEDDEHSNCKADGFSWPCPDRRILDGETVTGIIKRSVLTRPHSHL